MKLTNENYVKTAEEVMTGLYSGGSRANTVTTSKIRKMLAMVSDIYNDARHITGDKLDEDMRGRIQYLKMHVVYEAGRDPGNRYGRYESDGPIKTFIKQANILSYIDQIGNSKKDLIVFCHYMEALVAYHRYLGGKD